jgi:hypothetical protein
MIAAVNPHRGEHSGQIDDVVAIPSEAHDRVDTSVDLRLRVSIGVDILRHPVDIRLHAHGFVSGHAADVANHNMLIDDADG